MNTLSSSRPMRLNVAMRSIALMLSALFFAANAAVAQMGSIIDIKTGTCGKTESDNVTWSYTTLANTNMLTIAGTGEMADYNSNNHAPWYEYKDDIKTVVIGEGVTSIGKYAFYGLSELTSVSISASVACICSNAFEESGLTSIAFAEGSQLTSIGISAFCDCSRLASITIPVKVTNIDNFAFWGCGLTSVTFAEGSQLTSIGLGAFNGCSGLASITIPASVTSIGSESFAVCSTLTSITVEDENTEYVSDHGVLFNKDKTTLLCYPAGKTESSYNIPNSVTSIGISAFSKCSDLTSITIPASVTSIGGDAFRESGLTSIAFAEGSQLTSIGGFAFYKCNGLTSITIPASVTSIGYNAFRESGLTSVAFADGSQLTRIGNWAFYNCNDLTSITIPAGVKSIDIEAFRESGLTSVTILAPSLDTYGSSAFTANAEGRKIYVPEGSVDTYKTGWPDYADDILPISAKPTSIGNATMPSGNAQAADDAWYSLDGRKLSGKPTERGIFVHQGRKVVVK